MLKLHNLILINPNNIVKCMLKLRNLTLKIMANVCLNYII